VRIRCLKPSVKVEFISPALRDASSISKARGFYKFRQRFPVPIEVNGQQILVFFKGADKFREKAYSSLNVCHACYLVLRMHVTKRNANTAGSCPSSSQL